MFHVPMFNDDLSRGLLITFVRGAILCLPGSHLMRLSFPIQTTENNYKKGKALPRPNPKKNMLYRTLSAHLMSTSQSIPTNTFTMYPMTESTLTLYARVDFIPQSGT
jgi:hypothetical protein